MSRPPSRDAGRFGRLEQAGDGNQATIHGIGSQAEALEREHTEDRVGTRLTEYHDAKVAHP